MARNQTRTGSGKKSSGTSAKTNPQNQQSKGKLSTSNGGSKSGEGAVATEEQKKEPGLLETVKEIFSPVKPVDTTLEELFEDGLNDMYSAEKQLTEALPKLARACYSEELSHAFMKHFAQTKKQAKDLEKIMAYLKINPTGKKCVAMEGLIKEADEIIRHYNESPVRDSALIIGAQKVEHYEIAGYGSLCELADVLGFRKITDALERILEEEKETDALLTDIAMECNDEAYAQAASKKQKKQKRE